jgi:hypothetical protein
MAINITSLRENAPRVPQNVLDQMSAIKSSYQEFNLSLTIGLVLAILLILIIIVYIYRKQKKSSNNPNKGGFNNNPFKTDSLRLSFDESFERGIKFLNTRDFKSARLEYSNMKTIAKKSGEKEFVDKTLDFYKKYGDALNEKK